jgi:tRNA threonylcarbamoyladenosine biosynthesis protein TsaB
MRFIVIDTADSRGSVALFQNSEIQAIEEHLGDEDYSSWLLPAVKKLLSKLSLSVAELEGYAVCAGPGSFTGLRVGLTTVKAWAEIYRTPIAVLSRLEALITGEQGVNELFVATYFDARRDQIFAALYRKMGVAYELYGEESVTNLPAFLERVRADAAVERVRWISPDAALLESQPTWRSLAATGHVLQRAEPPFAAGLGRLAYRKFQQGETTDAVSLDANYVRRSDAEVLWKGNKSPRKA